MIYKIADRCTGCGLCAQECPEDAIIQDNGAYFITDKCIGCGTCFGVCPAETIVEARKNGISRRLGNGDHATCPICNKSAYKVLRRDVLEQNIYLNHCRCGDCGQVFIYKVDERMAI